VPVECDPDVVELREQRAVRGVLAWAPHIIREALNQAGEVLSMPGTNGDLFSAAGEALVCVSSQRLEHPVPGRLRLTFGNHHRLPDEGGQAVKHGRFVELVTRGDRSRAGDRPAPGEDREAGEQSLLVCLEELMRPVDGASQRLVAARVLAVDAQELETVLEVVDDFSWRHRVDSDGGELERQRDAVEAPAELSDVGLVLGG
jgi:hypothetical protein